MTEQLEDSARTSKQEVIRIYEELYEATREWAVKVVGGCEVQYNGWPCGTCFIDGLRILGLMSSTGFHQHNDPVDKANEVWRSLLCIRGDYDSDVLYGSSVED